MGFVGIPSNSNKSAPRSPNMEETNKEEQDSLKPEELAQLSGKVEKGEQLTEEEAIKALRALPHLKKSIDGLYSRTKTAEDERNEYKGKLEALEKGGTGQGTDTATPPQQPPKEGAETPPAEKELSVNDLLTFRQKGLSDVEIANLIDEAKQLGVPIAKFAESNLFQPWLDAQRAKAAVAQGTPPPSGSPSSGAPISGKPFAERDEEGRKEFYNKRLEGGTRRNVGV